MLTLAQEKWLDHLSDTDKVDIFPLDPQAESKFEEIKKEVVILLGQNTAVLHRGASSLGISGQKEIDVYIPVSAEMMESASALLENAWGKPKSVYADERIKFLRYVEDTKFEVMIVNKDSKSWIDAEKFHAYLIEHSEVLEQYKKLKEEAAGVSTREYYRRKIEFINGIIVTA
jgi:GrpB-like predicted nucleotidyltransferase (UPF0157 family)